MPRMYWTTPSGKAWASSCGSRWPPANWHVPAAHWDTLAKTYGASPSQLALAWLLHRSPVMLPIPGTSRVSHLEENTRAAQITLRAAEFQALSQAV